MKTFLLSLLSFARILAIVVLSIVILGAFCWIMALLKNPTAFISVLIAVMCAAAAGINQIVQGQENPEGTVFPLIFAGIFLLIFVLSKVTLFISQNYA